MRAKLELSKFDVNEKQGVAWFNKVQECFEIYNIYNDNKKFKYASMQLEGDTYNWYLWWKKSSFSVKLEYIQGRFL